MSDKSLLAKLLATENITVQKKPGIKTAYFDLKNRVLALPIWQGISNDLEDLLLVHETGHALDTPCAEEYVKSAENIANRIFGDKVNKTAVDRVRGFLNAIEDARIDKRQKRRYPGCRRNYLIGYKELVERDFFNTNNRDINTLPFIDRLNMYFKGGNIHYDIKFTSEENVLLKKVENAETWDQVEILTEEIYRFAKLKNEEQQELEITLLAGEEGEGEEGEEGESNDDFDGNDFEFDTDGNSSGFGEGDETTDSKGSGSGAGAGKFDPNENAPRSLTDEAWQKKSEEIVKDEDSEFVYLSMPDVDYDTAIHDYKKVLKDWHRQVDGQANNWRWEAIKEEFPFFCKKFRDWKQAEKNSVSFMVKEFEQKKAAEMYARISIAKTGVIDTNKLHSYKHNEDIFRRISTVPNGKNHGFVMFLDWSGSMQYGLHHTIKQLLSLTLFCKQIGVPFEVYSFMDCVDNYPFLYNKTDVVGYGALALRNILSSRMNLADLNFAMECLWFISATGNYFTCDPMGGTPLNDAIFVAPKIVNEFKARNKLEITNVIWLTDGESNPGGGVKNVTFKDDARIKRRYFYYVDPNTNKTYEWFPYSYGSTGRNTNSLLRILKDQTGCNLVGFFLYEYNFNRLNNQFDVANGNSELFLKARKFWSDNKYYPIKSAGYDEYYVIDTKALKNTKNELEIDNSGDKKMTARKMASAFSKFAQKKTVNRVLLRQFVSRIAGHSKKVA